MSFEPVHHLFRRAAERFHERTAVDCEGKRTTYGQLAERARAIAWGLASAEVGPGAQVAILTPDTSELVAAVIATLELGAAFVPLDREFPTARLDAIADLVGPRAWLVDRELAPQLAALGRQREVDAKLIVLDASWPPQPASAPAGWPTAGREPDPEGLCYVYFTSGSTGRPKAIGGRLKAIDHFIRWEVEAFGLGEGLRVSQLTSPAFDPFLRDVFVPLTIGGTVCAPRERETVLDARRLVEWLEREAVALVHCTPTLLRSILNTEPGSARLGSLRHVFLAGEALLPADVRRFRQRFGERAELINLYGPSETTMTKFFYRVRPEDADAWTIPIGQPMAGARAIVLDDEGQPCPPGKLGEIYIRTPYRSLGYLGAPELTRQVFVQNPFSDKPDDVVYKTGDLGRVREDGVFELVGRRDQQVKIRGVRVELAPIEDLLAAHDGVREAVVVDREDTQGNRYLCAYVVPARPLSGEELQTYLAERLPEPMVPSLIIELASLPRTLSGKVDRRALPDPAKAAGRFGAEYVAPRTPVEEDLCRLWSELLGIPKVGIEDDFLRIGGHSLLATLLLARIRSLFGVELPLRELFARPVLGDVALAVTRLQLEQEQDEEIRALLAEIQSLPDEAADQLLRREGEAALGEG